MGPPDANKFAGCPIGQCLGDALGFIVEGQPTTACSSYVDDVVRTGNARQLGRGRYPFGQYSDDSQLARELVLSIVDRGKFDAVDYAGRIATLFREDRIVGRGLATQAAADRLIRGIPWNEAGAPPPSAGNGSAMRAGPVGLFALATPTTWCERHTTKGASHTWIGVARRAQSRLLAPFVSGRVTCNTWITGVLKIANRVG